MGCGCCCLLYTSDKDSTKQISAGGLTKYMTLAVLLTNYADQLDSTFQMPFAISDYVYTKAGMTREDLLKGNAAIAEEFGKNVKAYCPDVKHIVVSFNPADITGLITLLYSGLKPSQATTLAALDSHNGAERKNELSE